MAWYQCMLHYGMVQRMSHYTMVPMHVTLLHDTYACHTMEWYQIMACYQCMSHYGMVSMHVTLWYGTNSYHTMA